MASSRTGTPTIIKLSRRICRIRGRLGASNLEARTSTEFAAAVALLAIACAAFELTDDQPGQIDQTGTVFLGDPDITGGV
jgi:hypothetical protein